jgi:hypothetical protein
MDYKNQTMPTNSSHCRIWYRTVVLNEKNQSCVLKVNNSWQVNDVATRSYPGRKSQILSENHINSFLNNIRHRVLAPGFIQSKGISLERAC